MTAVAQFLLWLALPCAIGYYCVDLCASRTPGCPAGLRFCLGFGIGIGAMSCAMFISTLLFGGRSLGFLVFGFITLILLLVLRVLQSTSGQANPHVVAKAS